MQRTLAVGLAQASKLLILLACLETGRDEIDSYRWLARGSVPTSAALCVQVLGRPPCHATRADVSPYRSVTDISLKAGVWESVKYEEKHLITPCPERVRSPRRTCCSAAQSWVLPDRRALGRPTPLPVPRVALLPAPAGRSQALTAGFLALVALCAGCTCERDKRSPYTPFGIASTLPSESPSLPATSSTSAAPPTFSARASKLHDPAVKELRLASRALASPAGWLFSRSLETDLDSDGQPELLAWLAPDPPKPASGGLWLFRPNEAARELIGFPGFLPLGEDCTLGTGLEQTGPRTVTLRVESRCQNPRPSRVPVQALLVVAPLERKPEMLQLRFAAPSADETLSVEVDSSDRDQDGHDDVRLSLSLATLAPERKASVVFEWFERTAGLSRDLQRTGDAFADIGRLEGIRAQGKTTSQQVPQRLANARRLFAFACAEGGTYRVTSSEGEALPCGDLRTARELYLEAEVNAALKQADPAAALGALRRADWYGGPVRAEVRTKVEKTVLAAVSARSVRVAALDVAPRLPSQGVQFSPLSFVEDSALLIQTTEGIQSYAWSGEQAGKSSDATDEVDPWPIAVQGPAGETLSGLAFPCDTPTLALNGQSSDGKLVNVGATSWLSPRPGFCTAGNSVSVPAVAPVQWTPSGLSVLLDGQWVGPERTAGVRGSPLSQNGEYSVAQSPLGLLVRGAGRTELWSTASDRLDRMSHCVISNSGQVVACIDSGSKVSLITPGVAPEEK